MNIEAQLSRSCYSSGQMLSKTRGETGRKIEENRQIADAVPAILKTTVFRLNTDKLARISADLHRAATPPKNRGDLNVYSPR
jgi:hypothetical protein